MELCHRPGWVCVGVDLRSGTNIWLGCDARRLGSAPRTLTTCLWRPPFQAILSACSPWFEEVLTESQHPHPIIIMKDVRYEDLRNIVRFIYTGEVSVPQHDLQDFLRTAELLEIKGLLRLVSLHAYTVRATVEKRFY